MEITADVLLIVIGSMIVTFLPRVLPLALLSKTALPGWLIDWLKHIPVAVMAALLAQEVLLPVSSLTTFAGCFRLLATLPALLVAVFTRSLLGTVLVGVLAMMLLRAFG